jgi:hypothetical protein
METDDQRLERLRAVRAADEKKQSPRRSPPLRRDGGLHSNGLYTKLLTRCQSLTLIPAGKAPNEDEAGNEIGW